jgi:pilus assembly protein FimV
MQPIVRVVMVMLGLQLSLASSLCAFAVGDITVHSRRGEPFAADIRLHLEARERDKEVEVTLGNQDAYRGEGLQRLAIVDTLQAGLSPGAREVIRLSSTVPLQEAAFDLVLLVRAGQVTIVKHYHVVLPAPAPVAVPSVASLPTIAPVAPVTSAPRAVTKARRSPQRTGRYGPVERGETLYSVAKTLHVSNDKLWQGVVALWQANKEQFQAGNLHGLLVGTFLEVPPDFAEHMATMPLSEAQAIIAEQWEEWRLLQRSGLSKQRVVVAARETDAPAPGAAKRDPVATAAAKREAVTPPVEKIAEKPGPGSAMVLPVGKAGNMVSMAELHTVLQDLEERLMRRLTPTTQAQPQEAQLPTAFVSTSELQASIQSLEERLTQRIQQMLSPTPEPAQVGQRPLLQQMLSPTPEPAQGRQRPLQPVLASAQSPPVVEAAQPVSLLLVPYLLVLTNALLLLLVGVLVWFWLRQRDREERVQRV